MSYNIVFCEGKGCARRDNCHRYLHLLRFRADEGPNRGDYIYIYMCRPDPSNCTLYWPEKGGDK